jgi:hypothetical protein
MKRGHSPYTRQYPWANAGSLTVVVAAGEAPIDVDKRANADIVALSDTKKVIYEPDNGQVAFEFRVRADGTEDDALVIPLYAVAGTDRYTLIGDLTCIQGTQEADDSAKFCDAISGGTNTAAWVTWTKVVAPGADQIARFVVNCHGYDRFLWVCTDLKTATNIYIDTKRH